MAVTKKIVGTGITAEERTNYSGEDLKSGVLKFFEAWNNAYHEGGGNYGAVTLQWIEAAKAIKSDFPDKHPERDSLPWFADQILIHHRIAVASAKRNEQDSAMRFAFDLGMIVERLRMKCGWEKHALRGEHVLAAARQGHEAVHGNSEAKAKRTAKYKKEFESEIERGTKKTAAYFIVAEKNGVSPKTIQRHVNS